MVVVADESFVDVGSGRRERCFMQAYANLAKRHISPPPA